MTDTRVLVNLVARLGFTGCCAISAIIVAAPHAQSSSVAAQSACLEIRVPFEPTAFPSAGFTHLFYELHITNRATVSLRLRRIEVIDAARANGKSIAAVETDQLTGVLQPLAGQTPVAATADRRQLAPGSNVIAFMSLALDRRAKVPDKLLNR